MPQSNHLKSIFNQPTEPTEAETQAKRNQREEDRKRDYQIWIDSLSVKELRDYQFVFGEL